jgi:hypothetical protein
MEMNLERTEVTRIKEKNPNADLTDNTAECGIRLTMWVA